MLAHCEAFRFSTLPPPPHPLASQEVVDICLLVGSHDWIPISALLAHAAFALPLQLSLSQTTSLLTFLLFSPHPGGEGSERAAGEGVWLFAAINPPPPPKTEWAVHLQRKLACKRKVGYISWSHLKVIWRERWGVNPIFAWLPFTKYCVSLGCRSR